MANTRSFTAASIDGFIADADNSLKWLFEAGSGEEKDKRFACFFNDVGAMVVGATTYRWALEEASRTSGAIARLVRRDTVLGHHASAPPADSRRCISFVRGPVVSVHERMVVAANGQNIWVVGGGDLAGQFADEGLLDEIISA